MSEDHITYTKLDDARLLEKTALSSYSQLLRVFDFDSEIITVSAVTLLHRTNAATSDNSFVVQQFNEVAARGVERAHKTLLELGGNPPPLDDLELREKKPRDTGKRDKQPLKIGS